MSLESLFNKLIADWAKKTIGPNGRAHSRSGSALKQGGTQSEPYTTYGNGLCREPFITRFWASSRRRPEIYFSILAVMVAIIVPICIRLWEIDPGEPEVIVQLGPVIDDALSSPNGQRNLADIFIKNISKLNFLDSENKELSVRIEQPNTGYFSIIKEGATKPSEMTKLIAQHNLVLALHYRNTHFIKNSDLDILQRAILEVRLKVPDGTPPLGKSYRCYYLSPLKNLTITDIEKRLEPIRGFGKYIKIEDLVMDLLRALPEFNSAIAYKFEVKTDLPSTNCISPPSSAAAES